MSPLKYPQEIQDLISSIEEERYSNQSQVMENCRQLIQYGRKKKDSYLLAIGYYYLAEGYYVQNNYYEFTEYLKKSMPYQQETEQWKLIARSYNMLGLKYGLKGNVAGALDHYLVALDYSIEYRLDYEKTLIYANIAELYERQKEYNMAKYYYRKSRENFESFIEDPFGQNKMIRTLLSEGRCCLYLNNIAEAARCRRMIQILLKKLPEDDYVRLQNLCFEARYYDTIGDTKNRDEQIAEASKELQKSEALMDNCCDIYDFCRLLLETEKYEILKEIFQFLDIQLVELGILRIRSQFKRLEACYYKKIQDEENYLKNCSELFELGEIQEEEAIESSKKATELRFNLEKAQQKEKKLLEEKARLIQKSETDSLSELPNRYKMNEYGDWLLKRALQEEKTMGVEILDIDYFKEYNDTYGHQKGDECIVAVSQVLKKAVQRDEDMFCARYGGDEFVIFYWNKSNEEIYQIADKLRVQVYELGLHNVLSKVDSIVTISQGICNRKPTEESKVWDYLHTADMALYKVKKGNRNEICIRNISIEED